MGAGILDTLFLAGLTARVEAGRLVVSPADRITPRLAPDDPNGQGRHPGVLPGPDPERAGLTSVAQRKLLRHLPETVGSK